MKKYIVFSYGNFYDEKIDSAATLKEARKLKDYFEKEQNEAGRTEDHDPDFHIVTAEKFLECALEINSLDIKELWNESKLSDMVI